MEDYAPTFDPYHPEGETLRGTSLPTPSKKFSSYVIPVCYWTVIFEKVYTITSLVIVTTLLQIIFKKDLTGIVLRITFVYIKTRKIMKTELEKTIIDLWHISRTALAGMSTVPTRHDRMIYIKNTLKEQYPDLIKHFQFSKHIWFAIEDTLSNSY